MTGPFCQVMQSDLPTDVAAHHADRRRRARAAARPDPAQFVLWFAGEVMRIYDYLPPVIESHFDHLIAFIRQVDRRCRQNASWALFYLPPLQADGRESSSPVVVASGAGRHAFVQSLPDIIRRLQASELGGS